MRLLRLSMLLALTVWAVYSACGQQKTGSPYFLISENASKESFPLLHTEADVNIAGMIADVHVTQLYKNEGDEPIEAIYVFPGSTNAAVYNMIMTVGNRRIQAKIQEKNKARKNYEKAKQEGKSASLLEQHRPNVFQMNVANILPGDTIKTELFYTELIVPDEGIYELVYPTVVGPRYTGETPPATLTSNNWVENPYLKEGEKTPYTFDIKMCLNAGMPVQKVKSSSHKIDVSFSNNGEAEILLNPSEKAGGNRDFILQYQLKGKKIESGVLVYEGEDEHFFLVMMQPPERVLPKEIPGREYIFIVDVSGSMHGFPLDISKKLLKDLIDNLRPKDKFNVLLFAGSAGFMSEKSLPATQTTIQKAIQTIDSQIGGGGTNMLNAIQKAGSVPKDKNFSRSFVIVTDGYVNVEPEVFDYIKNHLGEANFFAFGIGSSVNRHLIEGIARVGYGEPFIIPNPNEADAKAEKFRKYIQSPVLTNIETKFEGMEVYDVVPKTTPDLLGERPLIVFGKYKNRDGGKITVTGQSGKGNFKKTIDLTKIQNDGKNQALRQLWARHQIKELGDYKNLNAHNQREEIKTQITDLGLKYNLLTEFTSFIAVDENVRNPEGNYETVKQPLPLPKGVPNSAIGNKKGKVNEYLEDLAGEIEVEPPRTKEPPPPPVRGPFSWNGSEFIDHSLEEETIIEISDPTACAVPPPPPPPPHGVNEIYKVVEELPRFSSPDCELVTDKRDRNKCSEEKLVSFIYNNLKVPKTVKSVVGGMIVVRFVVEKDGSLSDIKVVRSIGKPFDEEAIRLVKSMPKWIPGRQRGRLVRVVYNLPIRIKLE